MGKKQTIYTSLVPVQTTPTQLSTPTAQTDKAVAQQISFVTATMAFIEVRTTTAIIAVKHNQLAPTAMSLVSTLGKAITLSKSAAACTKCYKQTVKLYSLSFTNVQGMRLHMSQGKVKCDTYVL